MTDDRLYVQIPAYRDSELVPTLRDLYARCDEPGRLRVCVVWQHTEDETLPPDVLALPGLEVVDIDAADSQGCNWARRIAQRRWAGEPHTLILDSHHRFVPGWDTLALGMYRQLLDAGVAKPLLTSYLPSYDPADDPAARRPAPYKIYPMEREAGLLTRLTSHPVPFWRELDAPEPADFLSLHFVLTAGGFNEEVEFDPLIYFFGDEVVTGLRAYTAGYDLFHPHRVVGWHAYDRSGRTPHWDDHPTWAAQHERSMDAMRRLFTGLDTTGLGTARTVADYERHIVLRLAS